MRAAFALGILCAALLTRPAVSQEAAPSLGEILRAEDHRAAGGAELGILRSGLAARDTLLILPALRALGSLERPDQVGAILPLLRHPVARVREAAVLALAQAAQGLRWDSSRETRAGFWPALLTALGERVSSERDSAVRGRLALALGRLPYGSLDEIAQAQSRLLVLGEGLSGAALLDVVRGMGALYRLTGRRAPPPVAWAERLRSLAGTDLPDPRIRRAALGALLETPSADSGILAAAARSDDPEVRRLGYLGIARLGAGEAAATLLHEGLGDPVGWVRYQALAGLARVSGSGACPALRYATRDSAPAAALLALDLLGTVCGGDSLAAPVAEQLLSGPSPSWHQGAHALVSLARLAPARARTRLPDRSRDSVWQVRMYSARAAAVLGDSALLRRLARDATPNVREAALAALAPLTGHRDDSLYLAALAAPDDQLVLTAARALSGTAEITPANRALLGALARITAERRETSRDARLALLARLAETGGSALASSLQPYLHDFDPLVADSAAALLSRWTARRERAAPRSLPPVPVPADALDRWRGTRLRFHLAAGGFFDVALLVDQAPLTVLRVAQLAAEGYYTGLSFHRVVPNFVIQGGSPGANEYAGAARFLRDEVGPLSHERGTLGISTRGRDTGDAQIFVNLVDNPRLDFEYTVWGRVVAGMAAVDAVREGDLIARVEIRPR